MSNAGAMLLGVKHSYMMEANTMMSMKMTMMNCDKHYDEHIDEIVWKCPSGTTSTKTPTTQLEPQFLNTNAKQIKMQIQLCGNVQILSKMWKCPDIKKNVEMSSYNPFTGVGHRSFLGCG